MSSPELPESSIDSLLRGFEEMFNRELDHSIELEYEGVLQTAVNETRRCLIVIPTEASVTAHAYQEVDGDTGVAIGGGISLSFIQGAETVIHNRRVYRQVDSRIIPRFPYSEQHAQTVAGLNAQAGTKARTVRIFRPETLPSQRPTNAEAA